MSGFVGAALPETNSSSHLKIDASEDFLVLSSIKRRFVQVQTCGVSGRVGFKHHRCRGLVATGLGRFFGVL